MSPFFLVTAFRSLLFFSFRPLLLLAVRSLLACPARQPGLLA